MAAMDDCWFCDDNRGGDTPPGGWLTTYGGWRAGHVPSGWGPAGTVVIETVDHHESLENLDDTTALAFSRLLGRTQTAVCEVTGAARAYVWATMDRHPHLHFWVVPWPADADLRGPRFLADVLTFDAGEPDVAGATTTADRLREILSG